MKKTSKRFLSLILSLTLILFTLSAGSAAFSTADTTPRRISVSAKHDGLTKGFCWYTDASTPSQVKIYLDDQDVTKDVVLSEIQSEEWEGSYMHKVTVSGLEGGKTYTYQVGDGNNWSKPGKFVTDDGDDSFGFITISDVHYKAPKEDETPFRGGDFTLRAAVKTIPEAEFFVNCGDFTDDSTNDEWNDYHKAFDELHRALTLVPVTGNHDGFGSYHWFNNMFNLDTSESVQTLNGVNYSFDYGNAHIAVLNTNDLMAMSDAQLKWFRNDMNSTDKDWKIAFMHKSPYSLGKDAKWPDALYLQESFATVCSEVNVDLVMSGHDHQYLRTKPLKNNALAKEGQHGTVYVLAGTAGTKRYQVRPFLSPSFLPAFVPSEFIDALVIQREADYGSWQHEKLQTEVGGCFSTVNIDGGKLELKAYILADEKDADGQDIITQVDCMTIEKKTGQNKISYTGDNTTGLFQYILDLIPSIGNLAKYAFLDWLPKFLLIVPYIIYSSVELGIF